MLTFQILCEVAQVVTLLTMAKQTHGRYPNYIQRQYLSTRFQLNYGSYHAAYLFGLKN